MGFPIGVLTIGLKRTVFALVRGLDTQADRRTDRPIAASHNAS